MTATVVDPNRGIEFCGLQLAHPVINGSGTFDALAAHRVFGDAVLEHFPFAAYVSKTITAEPRAGNPPPRLWEAGWGMVNSIGLPGKGLERFIAEDLPRLAELPVPVIVSVMAKSRGGFAEMVGRLGDDDRVSAIELNVSCPNVESGLMVGESADETAGLLECVRPLTARPLLIKLSPGAPDQVAVALAAEGCGADAISLINTLPAKPLGPGGDPWLGAGQGGLSGPAVREAALGQVALVAEALGAPVVGMGGICEAEHARQFLDAGATLVAVGTESFRDPMAGARIADALARIAEIPE